MKANGDYINRYCDEVYGFSGDSDRGQGFIDGAKWGLKEAVEWVEEETFPYHAVPYDSESLVRNILEEKYQAQKKRWGIETK